MSKEPSRLIGNAKRAMKLVGRGAFLASRHEVHGRHPFVQRYLAALHYCSDRDSELLTALVALMEASADLGLGIGGDSSNLLRIGVTAMRAIGPVGPALLLKPLSVIFFLDSQLISY
jgi:hypothetical protein